MAPENLQRAQAQRSQALRHIPSLDTFLRRERLAALPRGVVLRESRSFLGGVRDSVLAGRLAAPEVDAMFRSPTAETRVLERCEAALARQHRRVFNATGIVLHTGLGRAPLAQAAVDALADAAGYAIVEVDAVSGERNQRESVVATLLRDLTGAEAALVVNNNAAATTLALAALAQGREVVVSRGQLVEIGGGFRMPDVMAQAGCRMVEVGTTNRTHLRDFREAISAETVVLMLVHPSNFRIEGFTAMPSRAELAELARESSLHLVEDLGSGLLPDAPIPGLEEEPRVRDSVTAGVHLTCFSGDKLLGGPQCGIAVGEAELVSRLRAHPLYRALRCDKLCLAALEATLRIHRDGDPLREIPTLASLCAEEKSLQQRAERLAACLEGLDAEVVPSESFAGSGANPARPLPSFAVSLPGGEAAAKALRSCSSSPVFARIAMQRVLLDLRTLHAEDLEEVADLVMKRLSS